MFLHFDVDPFVLNFLMMFCTFFCCTLMIDICCTFSCLYFPIFRIFMNLFMMLRSSRPEMFYKKVFLEVLQNSKENTCARILTSLKKELWRRCLLVNFAKLLRTPFLTEHLQRLLLDAASANALFFRK